MSTHTKTQLADEWWSRKQWSQVMENDGQQTNNKLKSPNSWLWKSVLFIRWFDFVVGKFTVVVGDWLRYQWLDQWTHQWVDFSCRQLGMSARCPRSGMKRSRKVHSIASQRLWAGWLKYYEDWVCEAVSDGDSAMSEVFGVGPDAEDTPLASAGDCFTPVSTSSEPTMTKSNYRYPSISEKLCETV